MSSSSSRFRSLAVRCLAVGLVLATAVPLTATMADARAGGGVSSGSRGTRSFSAPAFTPTAPLGAAPFQRSAASPSGVGGGTVQPRRFGFGSGLVAGLLGAGLFGLFGGYGAFGALFQILLIGGLVMLAVRIFRGRMGGLAGAPLSRPRPAFADGLGAAYAPQAGSRDPDARLAPLTIGPRDFDGFEATLVDVQTAYGREDLAALGRLATPQMLRVFERDLRENHARGLRNDVGEARLLQGDLAESWREGPTDYASVAMRFSLRDLMIERASGRVLSGDPSRPDEVTELWTFRRDNGGPWLLSAIQQAR